MAMATPLLHARAAAAAAALWRPSSRGLPALPRAAAAPSLAPRREWRGPAEGRARLACRPPSLSLRAVRTMASMKVVPVEVAKELVETGHSYLDVRTPEEFANGHVEGAVNVPFMFSSGGGMAKNPSFLEDVSKCFSQQDKLVVGCQSGKRSAMAVNELKNAAYENLTDVQGGFGAWQASGLPMTK